MNRRRFLAATGGVALSRTGGRRALARGATPRNRPPARVAWWRTYGADATEEGFGGVARAHGAGHLLVGPAYGMDRTEDRTWLVVARTDGTVARHRRVLAGRAGAGSAAVRTADGYAVASGPSVAVLDPDLRVRATGRVPDRESFGSTELVELPDGTLAVAGVEGTTHTATTWVAGVDADATVRWARDFESSYQLSFLVPGPDGCVVGGTRLGDRSGLPWLAGLAPDGTERWRTTVEDAEWGAGSAVRAGDGFAVFGGGGVVRLDAARSVAWHRRYSVVDAPGVYGTAFARVADGGYVFAVHDDAGRVHVGRTGPDGRLRWTREYGDATGVHRVEALVERRPGEYLLVGRQRTGDWNGWAAVVTETPRGTATASGEPPTATRTAAGSPDPTPPATATRTAAGSPDPTPPATATRTPPSTPSPTTAVESPGAAVPGFGAVAALAAALGGAGLLRRRSG